jgi:cytochrome c-type biogenesis protein CcmH
MSRWLPVIAGGTLLAVAAVLVVMAVSPRAPTGAAERADALAAELRCPDCQGLSVVDSPTAAAREIRRQVAELVADGATDDQVREHFVDRYGEWILLAPSSQAAWLIPLAVVVLSVAALGAWLVSRGRSPVPRPEVPTAEQLRRVREEAEALDA